MVKNELRQCNVFARHNLLADPPFTKMDLVICRNTLIYFKSAAQERALRSLQYSIRQGGALLLGSSESLSAVSEGLQAISSKYKIFRRTATPTLPFMDRKGSLLSPSLTLGRQNFGQRQKRRSPDGAIADAGITELLSRFAPPAILVNEHHEAVHLYGSVRDYFQPREGSASLEVNRLLPEVLTPVASALLYKATRDQASLSSDHIDLVLPSGERRCLCLSAHPVLVEGEERMTLLCFEVQALATDSPIEPVNVDAETIARISVLERELGATRESLQATIEELETSNEELQSSNEELQSVNEEMSTVNAEFQEKMLVLNRLNADLDSMAKAAGVATVFVDAAMVITRFSPDAMQIFKLRESDVGRRLDDIAHLLRYEDLMADLAKTLKTERMIEREVLSVDGKHSYLARILPYVVPSSTQRGAVATFVDMTAFHDAKRLQTIIDALPEHIAVVDQTGTIVMVNSAWRRFARANGNHDLTGCPKTQ